MQPNIREGANQSILPPAASSPESQSVASAIVFLFDNLEPGLVNSTISMIVVYTRVGTTIVAIRIHVLVESRNSSRVIAVFSVR